MATVDLNHVQFWAPPSNPFLYKQRTTSSLHNKADRIFKRNDQSKSTIIAARHQGDDFAARAQGIVSRNNDSTNHDDEADDNLPSIEEILGLISHQGISTRGDRNAKAALQDLDKPALDTSKSCISLKQPRLDNGVGNSQGTQDRPVILEDDELDTPNPEAVAASALVDAGADSAFRLSKLVDSSNHEAWYNVEASCYVNEDLLPFPLLEQEGLASTLAQGQPHSRYHSPRPSHDRINQHDNDRNTQCTSEEPGPYTLPQPLDEDGRRESRENVSELEIDILLAFEEQEKSSSATAPSSPRPPRRYTEPPHPQIDQEHEQGRTSYSSLEGLRHSSLLLNQNQVEEIEEEVAADAIKEGEEGGDDDDSEQQGKQGEKRRRQDGTEEVSSDIHQSEGSDCSHNTNDEEVEDDEDDEEPQPAKRRKLPSAPTHKALTPPLDHNSKARLRQPHSITPLLTTQLEVDDTLSQADPGNPPTPVDDEQHHISRTSRSPSAPTESVPIAEYQEWPCQGFLKRTKIGNETMYNLEFKLPCISGRLNLPINPEALHICSSREAPAKAAILNKAVAHSKIYPAALRPQIKRAPWTPEEDATLLKMRNEGCSWEDIHAALPHRSKGTIQVRYSTKLKR